MSNALLNSAWATDLPGTAKLVLVCLADFARPDGRVWLPIDGPRGLVTRCGLARRTVQHAIAKLVRDGHILRQERPGRGVLYIVQPGVGAAAARAADQHASGAAAAPNPKQRDYEEAEASLRGISTPPCGVEPLQWRAFIESRAVLGRPLTAHAAELIRSRLSLLASDSGQARAILDQSIMNGWGNVFPIRGSGNRAKAKAPAVPPGPENSRPALPSSEPPIERCTPEQAAAILRELAAERYGLHASPT